MRGNLDPILFNEQQLQQKPSKSASTPSTRLKWKQTENYIHKSERSTHHRLVSKAVTTVEANEYKIACGVGWGPE